MRFGFVRADVRTTYWAICTLALASCLVASGCKHESSDSSSEGGAPADGKADAAHAGAGAGGRGSAASDQPTGEAGNTADDEQSSDDQHASDPGVAGAANDSDDDEPAAAEDGGTASEDDSDDDDPSATEDGGATSKHDHPSDEPEGAGGAGASDEVAAAGTANDDDDDDDDEPTDPDQPVEQTLCQSPDGEMLPYDYSFGIVQEYALDLSMDCNVGGHLMPLVMEDPDQLSAVLAFESQLVDWYRVHILGCPDESSGWSASEFGLLPPNDAGFSRGDIAAAVDVFMTVVDRHDGSSDGMTADQKAVVRARFEAIGAAVALDSEDVTMPLECAPEEGG